MNAKEAGGRGIPEKRTSIVEGAAMSASLLCLVHCLALPALLLLLPGALGLFAQSEAFHYAALTLVVPAALAAFWLGYRRHGTVGPAALGAAGVACLVGGLLHSSIEDLETVLTVTGSLLLIAGHTINWRLRTRA